MQPAVVLEPGPLATVMITRPTMCGNCGLCQTRGGTHRVRAVDLVGALRGQQVLIDFPQRTFLLAAMLSFGIPLAGLLAGLLLGTAAAAGLAGMAAAGSAAIVGGASAGAGAMGLGGSGTAGGVQALGGVAGGALGLGGAYFLLHLLDRRLLRLPRPVIVAICPQTGGEQ